MPNKRDEFKIDVIRTTAQRVNYLCSCPSCRCLTISASEEGDSKYSSIGEAAHICAAAPGGKRYDANMSEEQRKSIDNCIWLCKNHARLIDTDETKYTVELLKKWKQDTETYVSKIVALGKKKAENNIHIFEEWYKRFLISDWGNISSFFLKPRPMIRIEVYDILHNAVIWLEKNIHLIKDNTLFLYLKSFLNIAKSLDKTFISHSEISGLIYRLVPYRYGDSVYKSSGDYNRIEELLFELVFELTKSANKISDILREEYRCEFANEKINIYYTCDVTVESTSIVPEYEEGENTDFSFDDFLKDEQKRLFEDS